ncbi:uncharacterized protein N7496_000915 [Penicillium cataractarum]|uniref:NWD NACHT-NTPase N-terminal domain-containing protein n=1 Tax=Penicillium cataractarum TaxID=2100454 RepID=A0A9W9VUX9_9EURO|nr:uncharacterized protein N7496_000915 [Penicillium cataractarum]KAJ5389847.1 hypothetical protein N7496_000915 [Penicillium cataractarum]
MRISATSSFVFPWQELIIWNLVVPLGELKWPGILQAVLVKISQAHLNRGVRPKDPRLLLNPSEQTTAAHGGLEAVPFAVRRLRVMERLIRPGNTGLTESDYQPDSLQLVRDFEDTAVELYKTILVFQIRLVRQHSRNWAKRYGRDVFKADDWADLTSRIKTLEAKCTEIAQDLSRERIERALQDSEHDMQSGLQKIQQELEKTTHGIEKQTMMQSTWRQTDEERNCNAKKGLGNGKLVFGE